MPDTTPLPLPPCPRDDCTSTSPHHDHNLKTGEVRDRTKEHECAHWESSNYTRCYASRLGSTAAHSKLEAPKVGTPIDPADVRVGDRVRFEYSATIDIQPQPDGKNWVGHDFADRRFYLLDRPDPDAPLVEAIARAILRHDTEGVVEWERSGGKDTYLGEARAVLDALRAEYVIEPKAVQS